MNLLLSNGGIEKQKLESKHLQDVYHARDALNLHILEREFNACPLRMKNPNFQFFFLVFLDLIKDLSLLPLLIYQMLNSHFHPF